MSCAAGPVAVTNGLVLELDAANIKSFGPPIVDILLVGGGGAGGINLCGAGGGGAVGYFTGFKVSAGTAYSIVVGAGGIVTGNYTPSGAGGSTTAFGETAGGGQGGGQGSVNKSGNAGLMTILAAATQYISAIIGSGNVGGNSAGYNAGSGGGGAGAAALSFTSGNSSVGTPATNGGAGLYCNISGYPYYWGGGGGGQGYPDYAGSGGIGGGGGGGTFALGGTNPNVGLGGGSALNSGAAGTQLNNTTNGGAGGTNTGGGGGAGSHTGGGQTSTTGGAGGTGIVVIRYAGPQKATGGTITTNNSYTIHTFTTSGTFTPGANWADISGNNIAGTLTNGPIYSSANGGSIVFDGVNDYILVPFTQANLLASDTSFTVNVILSKTSKGVGDSTFMFGVRSIANGSNEIALILYGAADSSTDFGFVVGNNSGMSLSNRGTVVNTLGFHMYTGVYTFTSNASQSVVKYYDGVQVGSVVSGSGTTGFYKFSDPNGGGIWLGGAYATNNVHILKGKYASLQIYNRALSADEVTQNFNALRGRYGI
jgi:hypothetical protein